MQTAQCLFTHLRITENNQAATPSDTKYNVAAQLATVTGIVDLAAIVAYVTQARSNRMEQKFTDQSILFGVCPVVVLVVNPAYATETSLIGACKAFIGLFLYSSLLADCSESLLREIRKTGEAASERKHVAKACVGSIKYV